MSLFTAEQLAECLSQNNGEVSSHLEITNFEGQKVDARQHEQALRIHRGLKAHFASLLEFWVNSLNVLTWDEDYKVKGGEWEVGDSLTDELFYQWIDFRRHIPEMNSQYADYVASLRLRGVFQQAVLVIEEWNYRVVLAESDEEYFVLHWAFYDL